jgi:hypothetical protein
MEAAGTSKTLVNLYQTTECNNSEDSHLQKISYLSELFPKLSTACGEKAHSSMCTAKTHYNCKLLLISLEKQIKNNNE